MTDSEIIIKNAPHTIKAKIDWVSGKITNLEGDEVYIACYPDPKIFWGVFSPKYARKYFIFKNSQKKIMKRQLLLKVKV